ncbi:MAG TPA: histidine kinase dimerization/phospho-acceptor domain-containing protein, partial [Thermodesulfobacteriota bacterium]|nr:histidine kinase dimerization/phospho-acceptor domain-containing protein [Thermodesulfobacteriota bacterium]
MTRSIFTKVFVAYALMILLLSGLVLTFSFGVIREIYLTATIESLTRLGSVVASSIALPMQAKRYEEVGTTIADLSRKAEIRITVIDPGGTVIADSKESPRVMENHRGRPEIREALDGRVGSYSRFSTTLKEDMLYVAVPVRSSYLTIGVVRMSRPLSDIDHLLSVLKKRLWHLAGVIIVVSLVGALAFSRSLTKPVRDLREAVHRVASGDFGVKVFMKSRDEIKDLADSFNMMTDQIKELFDELSRQKDSLNSIVASVQEGLAVLGDSGRIVRSNESFQKVASSTHVEGKFYWEVIREASFAELVKKVLNEEKNLVQEVELNKRMYLCSVALLQGRGEAVIMLHDITDIKNIENLKKDFIANVSHELRTPLTAIKGFAETLETSVSEEDRRYVDIIKRNADRLGYIIQDLLVLSELEDKGQAVLAEEVDLPALVERATPLFKERLGEKNLAFTSRIDPDLPVIQGDAFRLEQMLINLIDNAIKYTEKGSITLSLSRKE